jgi:hypothetical protein
VISRRRRGRGGNGESYERLSKLAIYCCVGQFLSYCSLGRFLSHGFVNFLLFDCCGLSEAHCVARLKTVYKYNAKKLDFLGEIEETGVAGH